MTPDDKQAPVTERDRRIRRRNWQLFIVLVLFALALWGMTFIVRVNYIKGLHG